MVNALLEGAYHFPAWLVVCESKANSALLLPQPTLLSLLIPRCYILGQVNKCGNRLKCNREKPCQNCIVRGEGTASSCTYAEKAEKKVTTQSNPRSDAEDMRKRLNRLESSIISMLADKKEPAETINFNKAIPTVIEAPEQAGGQKMSHDTRSTHWDAILSEVCVSPISFLEVWEV
jgi:hypothetical protein